MGFWINSFKTPLFNHAIVSSNVFELMAAVSKWVYPVKTIFEVGSDWEYGIVVYTKSNVSGTCTIKYAKNIKGNKFIDNDKLVNVPGVNGGLVLDEEIKVGNNFVVLGYFDSRDNFYAVELCDLCDDEGRRAYIKCCAILLWKLKSAGFSVPIIPRNVRKAKVIKDAIPQCSQGDKSILIIPSTAYDQAILYKPNNKASHES